MTLGDGIKPAFEVFCPSNVAYSLWGGLITVPGKVGGWLYFWVPKAVHESLMYSFRDPNFNVRV